MHRRFHRSRRSVPVVPAKTPRSLWPLVVAVYAIGAMVFLLRLIVGWWAVARLTRRASPVAFCCDAPVRESPLVATPVTAGVLAPTIILPTGWTEWPAEKLRACIAHELAHIQRRDPLVAFIAHREPLCLLVPSAGVVARTDTGCVGRGCRRRSGRGCHGRSAGVCRRACRHRRHRARTRRARRVAGDRRRRHGPARNGGSIVCCGVTPSQRDLARTESRRVCNVRGGDCDCRGVPAGAARVGVAAGSCDR